MKTTTRLRHMLQTAPMVVAPFILNAMHAKIAEATGLPAVYMTGAGTIAERGFPHVGRLAMSEMVTNAPDIADALQLPTICDADTGSGNPRHMQRTGQVNAECSGTRWDVADLLGLEHVTDGIVWRTLRETVASNPRSYGRG